MATTRRHARPRVTALVTTLAALAMPLVLAPVPPGHGVPGLPGVGEPPVVAGPPVAEPPGTGAPGGSGDRGRSRPRRFRSVRVATFNIHHGAGLDGRVDLERIARVVESAGAEVVGLQEVDRHFHERSRFVDQATWLARRLGMQVAFGPNLDLDPLLPDAPRRQYGNAVLSAFPIRGSSNVWLPRPEGGEQRGLLEADILVRGAWLRVFSTHLQNDSAIERAAQVGAIRGILGEEPASVVLLGDLNAAPGSAEVRSLTGSLLDAWATRGVGDGYTYDAATPHARIDYVLSSPDVVARTAAVVTTDASDHLPVVADMALPGRPGPGHEGRPVPAPLVEAPAGPPAVAAPVG